jgi:hypothetical protein
LSARTVPLTQGAYALVDEADYELVTRSGPWHLIARDHLEYARRGHTLLHSFLTGWPLVDHINGDGLDNRRANLRPATVAQNGWNSRPQRNSRTGLKGVAFLNDKPRNKPWSARIMVHGRRIALGYYATAAEAAAAYDTAALKHYGEFARPNFPPEVSA